MAAQGDPKLSACKKVKNLTFILLLLFSTTCWGEWTKVAEGKGADHYIDFESIKKRGASVYYWRLADRLKPGTEGDMSGISYLEGDCEKFRMKFLKMTVYRDSMGTGESDPMPESSLSRNWMYPHPDSSDEWILKAACGQ